MKATTYKEALKYFISAAGIVIGIFVLIAVLEMGEGGKKVLQDNFWSNGVKVYDIMVSGKGSDSGNYLQPEDGKRLEKEMSEVKGSIPVLQLSARLNSYKASESVQTLGVNEKYRQYANLEMLKGSFVKGEDVKEANRIAVIDDLTALELFGTTDIIGQKLDIQVGSRKVEFVIIGVFKNFNKNIETLFDDEIPGICFIPDSVPKEVSFDYSMEKLIALVDKELHRDEAAVRLGHFLGKKYGVSDIYSIDEYDQLPKVSEFIDKYLVFAVITALVGLLSGAVGVMNAMLLSIQDNRKEIGLYKFFGSGIKELQYEIIYVSMIICIGSGALGMILGILTGSFIGGFINLPAGFTIKSIFVTLLATTAAGISSSLYPAATIKKVDAGEAIWGE